MKLKDGFVLREVAGENVVIPSGGDLALNMMMTLNDTGAFLWRKLEEETSERALVQALLSEYDVDEENAAKHVSAFVEKLRENEVLV